MWGGRREERVDLTGIILSARFSAYLPECQWACTARSCAILQRALGRETRGEEKAISHSHHTWKPRHILDGREEEGGGGGGCRYGKGSKLVLPLGSEVKSSCCHPLPSPALDAASGVSSAPCGICDGDVAGGDDDGAAGFCGTVWL